ncbi:AGAP006975-PA-like protein [Anopheles sinensis]|uniref:AGAP006975-PA-like protein n=1 Tax=Anopheles sinensis TaxID=74873 RepID=A0A084WRN2_ANOSI|nr:AGAP006975-PA-like protein [Anopheles sinensis]
MVDGLRVNSTQSPLGETLLGFPNRDLSAGATDAINDDPTGVDMMFVTLVFFLYLVQIVKFLTLPLRERLEQQEEVQRLKRVCMILVKVLLSGAAS